jgi:hypothetical protein
MADAVSTKVLFNGTRKLIIQITNLSDGTGESAVVKVDKSGYTGSNGLEPSKFVVEKIQYDVTAMRVHLYFDRTTDQTIAVLQGNNELCYTDVGGLVDGGTGDTGDIVLTTTGAAAGDGYNIILHLRKKD